MSENIGTLDGSVDLEVGTAGGELGDAAGSTEPAQSIEAPLTLESLFGDDSGEIDWEKVDYRKLDERKAPPELRPHIRLAKQLQRSFTRSQSKLTQAEKQYQTLTQHLQTQAQTAPAAGQPEVQQSEAQVLQSMLAQYGFSNPEAPGYAEFALVAKMVNDARQAQASQLAPLVQYVMQLAQQVQGLGGQVQQTVSAPYQAQLSEFQQAGYDLEDLQDERVRNAMVQLVDQVENPATPGKPHTIKTAFELLTGRTAAASGDMAQRAARAKATARGATISLGGGPASAKNGRLSTPQVLGELRKLGFE